MIALNKKYLREVQTIIECHIPDSRVRAFGSRVTGKSGKFSDLDLAVEDRKELSLATIVRIKEAFRESNLPFKVDVLDWLTISNRFRRQIEQECVIIHGDNKND